jgi:hypothetical protein
MFDKDTHSNRLPVDEPILSDGPEEPTPVRGLRASNTIESMRPKEVRASEYSDPISDAFTGLIQKTDARKELDLLKEIIYRPKGGDFQLAPKPESPKTSFVPKPPLPPRFSPIGSLIDDRPYYSPAPPVESLEERVTYLEEQVSALLDRIAKYNVRAQHRI